MFSKKNPVYGEKFGPWKNKIDGETLFRAGTLERDDFKIQAFYPPVSAGKSLVSHGIARDKRFAANVSKFMTFKKDSDDKKSF